MINSQMVTMQIWDTAGQERLQRALPKLVILITRVYWLGSTQRRNSNGIFRLINGIMRLIHVINQLIDGIIG